MNDVSGDFKKFASKKIIKAIKDHLGGSRKEGMLKYLKKQEKKTAGIQNINFGNRIINPRFIHQNLFAQKLEYIHNNPVDAGIVEKAEEYIFTAA